MLPRSAIIRATLLSALLLLRTLSIVICSLPFRYNSGSLFEAVVISIDGVALLVLLALLATTVTQRRPKKAFATDATCFGILYFVGMALSIGLTIRWNEGSLFKDFASVPNRSTFEGLVVLCSWLSAILTFVTLLVSCTQTTRGPSMASIPSKEDVSTKRQRISLPIQSPPASLSSIIKAKYPVESLPFGNIMEKPPTLEDPFHKMPPRFWQPFTH